MRSYNPLRVETLGQNSAAALMEYPAAALPPDAFEGIGVYTLHYSGTFEPYAGLGERPVYVGKADKGVHARLGQHARSVDQALNLDLADFRCRWLVMEEVWVGLTEQVLIAQYRPVWNIVVKGFGIHTPGSGRGQQRRSPWDTLHPGRPFAEGRPDNRRSAADLITAIRQHREQHDAQT